MSEADPPGADDTAREGAVAGEADPGDPGVYGHGSLAAQFDPEDVPDARGPGSLGADRAVRADPADDRDPGAVFPQSVASGGPTPEGVILWTRVAPGAVDPDAVLGVEVAPLDDDGAGDPGAPPERSARADRATDGGPGARADAVSGGAFEDPLFRGVVEDAGEVRAHDCTVKVDLDGVLAPGRAYRYRFVYDGVASRVGRCRTLPAPGATPDSLRLGVLTCQNYCNGYYGALAHLAADPVDFVVHVGDFIYESDSGDFKGPGSDDYPGREVELPSGNDRVHTLEDYRYLYRTYRRDPNLQRLLERHTLIPAWDDHEFADDVYWDPEAGVPRAHHPNSDDGEFMTRLVADAMHAWWEYMPARVRYDADADRLHERFELWRSFVFGDLVELVMTDERLYRDPPREGVPWSGRVGPEHEPEGRSMLGETQREWFLDEATDGEATWTVWTDEVLTVPFRVGVDPLALYPVQGGWDGYTRERELVAEALAEADDVENFVTLTGDMHCYVAGYKQRSYPGPLRRLLGAAPERYGVEFMTPPTTSLNVAEFVGVDGDPTGITQRLLRGGVGLFNPHLRYFDSHNWGYSVVEFTPDACTYVGYAVDKAADVTPGTAADADRRVLTAWEVPEGVVELRDVTDRERDRERERRRERERERESARDRPAGRPGS